MAKLTEKARESISKEIAKLSRDPRDKDKPRKQLIAIAFDKVRRKNKKG